MPAGRMIPTAKSHETYAEVASTFCRSISWGPFVLAQQEILEISRFNFQYQSVSNIFKYANKWASEHFQGRCPPKQVFIRTFYCLTRLYCYIKRSKIDGICWTYVRAKFITPNRNAPRKAAKIYCDSPLSSHVWPVLITKLCFLLSVHSEVTHASCQRCFYPAWQATFPSPPAACHALSTLRRRNLILPVRPTVDTNPSW